MGIEGEPAPSPQPSARCPGSPAGAGDILPNISTHLSCAAQIVHAQFSELTVWAKCERIAHGVGKNAQTQRDYSLIKFQVKLP